MELSSRFGTPAVLRGANGRRRVERYDAVRNRATVWEILQIPLVRHKGVQVRLACNGDIVRDTRSDSTHMCPLGAVVSRVGRTALWLRWSLVMRRDGGLDYVVWWKSKAVANTQSREEIRGKYIWFIHLTVEASRRPNTHYYTRVLRDSGLAAESAASKRCQVGSFVLIDGSAANGYSRPSPAATQHPFEILEECPTGL